MIYKDVRKKRTHDGYPNSCAKYKRSDASPISPTETSLSIQVSKITDDAEKGMEIVIVTLNHQHT